MSGRRTQSVIYRFWSHVNKTETCWEWTASLQLCADILSEEGLMK